MVELIALIILIGSVLGMMIIIWRKIPALAELPEGVREPKQSIFLRLKNKIAGISVVKDFNFLAFLQKILSKIRVLTLKTENKIAGWLQKLREKSQKKQNFANDNYWQELKNSKEENNKKGKIKPE